MIVLRTGYSTIDLAEQLRILPLELIIRLEGRSMGENPRTSAAVLVKEKKSASHR
jgi:hypothetical protein